MQTLKQNLPMEASKYGQVCFYNGRQLFIELSTARASIVARSVPSCFAQKVFCVIVGTKPITQ